MAPNVKVTKDELERACRMYRNRSDAARALGVAPTSMDRIFVRLGVESPWKRKNK
jgi:hypothetical protein